MFLRLKGCYETGLIKFRTVLKVYDQLFDCEPVWQIVFVKCASFLNIAL